MAIIIPSKNIYEINNPKIRDNVVDNVSVQYTIVKPNNQYRQKITTEQFNIGIEDCNIENDTALEGEYRTLGENNPNWKEGIAYSEISAYYYNGEVKINKNSLKNSTITKIYDLKDNNGNPNIGVSVTYDKYNGTSTAKFRVNIDQTPEIYDINTIYQTEPSETISGQVGSLEVKTTNNLEVLGISQPFTATAVLIDKTNISDNEISEFKDYFNFYFRVLVGKEEISIVGTSSNAAGLSEASGTCVKYVPKQVQITFYGDTIGIDLSDGNITYILDENQETIEGTGKKPFSLSGNELLQDNSNRIKLLASGILNQYRNGKETAVIRCSIGNYYDDLGNKVISIDEDSLPMTFSIGDIVKPMIYSVGGVDKPMSLYNGEAKTFRVVGRKPYYNGAVWQELTLQEV